MGFSEVVKYGVVRRGEILMSERTKEKDLVFILMRMSRLFDKLVVGELVICKLSNSKFTCQVRLVRNKDEGIDTGSLEVFLFSNNNGGCVHYIKIDRYQSDFEKLENPWYMESIPCVKGVYLPAKLCCKLHLPNRREWEMYGLIRVVRTEAQLNTLHELMVDLEKKVNSKVAFRILI